MQTAILKFVAATIVSVLGVTVGVLMQAYSVVAEGFVLSKLWVWFFVKTFGLPQLGICQTAGIACAISMVAHQFNDTSASKKKLYFAWWALDPWVRLLTGWLIWKAMSA
jgi:hypothetical protein